MRLLRSFPALVIVACAAAPPPDSETPAPVSEPTPAATSTIGPSPSGPTEPGQADPAATASVKEEGPSACPTGMKLVEGEYCTKVEQNCKRSWYAPWNKKTVCELFEEPSKCIGERVKKRFCIDTYSWPNVKGERPEVMNTFYQAQVKCATIGKRMCTESEWTFACEGPEMKPYPYGYERDTNKCNGDHAWDHPKMNLVARRDPKELARLWKGVRSGSQPECVSDFGVHDLPGNNDEVVASEPAPGGQHRKYDSIHTGGPWYEGVRNQCRPKIYTHDEGFYYYFLGFRCCAEPDNAETEPRTAKQQHSRWNMDRVERLAGFTRAEMKEKLELKAQGKCSCAPRDVRCNTMCGTLLGPEAKDADLAALRGRKAHEQKK
ncbi:MAG: SUMF1/EgtB/PvdO family nonheme iron enzyme [Polyangiaceae bacterium]|nr:SUMF1/EgtB/PvdO family nonheme iron enzyme [Polyangiaceae bacterium]